MIRNTSTKLLSSTTPCRMRRKSTWSLLRSSSCRNARSTSSTRTLSTDLTLLITTLLSRLPRSSLISKSSLLSRQITVGSQLSSVKLRVRVRVSCSLIQISISADEYKLSLPTVVKSESTFYQATSTHQSLPFKKHFRQLG